MSFKTIFLLLVLMGFGIGLSSSANANTNTIYHCLVSYYGNDGFPIKTHLELQIPITEKLMGRVQDDRYLYDVKLNSRTSDLTLQITDSADQDSSTYHGWVNSQYVSMLERSTKNLIVSGTTIQKVIFACMMDQSITLK